MHTRTKIEKIAKNPDLDRDPNFKFLPVVHLFFVQWCTSTKWKWRTNELAVAHLVVHHCYFGYQ
jgi:hypothetical protein